MIVPPPIRHPIPGKRLLIFDADGTLRRCTVPGQPCPNTSDEWELLPNVVETLDRYDWQGRHIWCAIISNQGGIGLGYLKECTARKLLQDLRVAMFKSNNQPWHTTIELCPHAPAEGCVCRKPSPVMLEAVQMPMHSQGFLHGPDQVLYVGDMESDREAAERAKIDFCWAKDFFGWPQ